MPKINRRTAIKLLGAGAALALGGGIRPLLAQPARPIKVTQAVTSLAYIQSFVARELGYFAARGLEAELVNTGGGGPDVQIVLAGRAEFTVNDGAQVLPAVQQGQQLTCVLALLDKSIINVTMRRQTAERLGIEAGMPVEEKVRRMRGLRVGVTRPGALTWQMARYNIFSAGMNPDTDVSITGMGDAPSLAAALRQGNLDAIYISVPIGETLVAQGEAITLIDNSRGEDPSLPSFLMEGLWATPDFIARNGELVAAAVNAYRNASDWLLRNEPQAIAEVLKPVFSGLTEEVLLEGVGKVRQAVSASGEVDRDMLGNTQRVLEVNGILKREFAVSEIFDPSFLRA